MGQAVLSWWWRVQPSCRAGRPGASRARSSAPSPRPRRRAPEGHRHPPGSITTFSTSWQRCRCRNGDGDIFHFGGGARCARQREPRLKPRDPVHVRESTRCSPCAIRRRRWGATPPTGAVPHPRRSGTPGSTGPPPARPHHASTEVPGKVDAPAVTASPRPRSPTPAPVRRAGRPSPSPVRRRTHVTRPPPPSRG